MARARVVTSSDGRAAVAAFVASLWLVVVAGPATAQPVAVGDEFVLGTEADSSYQSVARTRAVSRAADGSFVVAWQRAGYGRTGIFVQRYDSSGNPLGTEFRVSGEETAQHNLNSVAPAVAHTQGGEFVVVWRGVPSSEPLLGWDHIVGQRVDTAGMPVGTEFRVSIATASGYGLSGSDGPDLAAMDDGSFVVVWPGRPDPGQYLSQIMGQRMAADATKIGTEFMANTFSEGNAYDPQIGTRGDGSFVVVWAAAGEYPAPGPDGNAAGVFGQRFAANGSPLGTEFQVNTFTVYSQDAPDLAVRGDGSFVVVWRTQYGDDETFDDSITMRRYDASGNAIGDEVHINSYLPGAQRAPAIAMKSDGSFVVVWESHSGYYGPQDNRDDGDGLFGRCFASDGAGGVGELHVNAYTSGIERNPSIATTGSGEFVVVWERVESPYGIGDAYARRFTMASCPTTEGETVGLDVTKTDNGRTWDADPVIPYEITVTSRQRATTGVVIEETVPINSSFEPASSTTGWVCSAGGAEGNPCTYPLGDLATDQSKLVTFAVRVSADTEPSWSIFNSAVARGFAGATGASRGPAGPSEPDDGDADDEETHGSAGCSSAPLFCIQLCLWCGILDVLGGNVPEIATETCGFTDDEPAKATRGLVPSPASLSRTALLYRMRDRVFHETRGGRRATELYYEHSPAMYAAVVANPSIAANALDTLDLWRPGLEALVGNVADSVVVTQGHVDALDGFLDALRAVATGELAAAIDRERTRMQVDDWVGLTFGEAFDRFGELSCEGYEDTLFCGEVTGDCTITATDALGILRIAVGTDAPRPESDVDGSGGTTATDALFTLRIAVGITPPTSACNPV